MHDSLLLSDQHFLNGTWQTGRSSTTLQIQDAYSGELLADILTLSAEQMEAAIQASVEGFQALKSWSAQRKSQALEQLANLLEAQAEAFAQLIAAEAGKPIWYARGEIKRCLLTLRTAAAEALRFGGEVVPLDFAAGEGRQAFTRRFPIGPIAAISPFNFPLNLALHKIAPALAVGCSILLKPSPYAPLSALAFARLVEQTDLPAGAVQVVLADIPEAELMVRDERLKMLSFTGSPGVGWKLKSLAGKKRVCLELGGNAAVYVDESADLATAAKRIALGAYLYAGQICISTQRIYVHEAVRADFQELLLAEIQQLPVGDPADDSVRIGPLIAAVHLKRVQNWVVEAMEEGASCLLGGKVLDEPHLLYAPTLLTDTRPEMNVVAEEVFGPVAILESVPSFEAGLAAINDSRFGLQAGIFTHRLAHLRQAHEQLEVGAVLMNEIPGFRVDSMPYGGAKDSGFGREGICYAMEEMTEPRLLVY
ncbi:MAG: aldehyde dehydrogenase family protein [Bacteroidota bacterium]